MRVLVACEYSGRVRDAFLARGHDAISCDLLPSDTPGPHLQCDVATVLGDGWDLLIAHPPCTYLCNSGVRWLYEKPGRWALMAQGADFFRSLLDAPVPRVAVENPVMHGYAAEIIGQRQTQIVQPHMFGHMEVKATGLWLRGLPPLVPTHDVKEQMMALPYAARAKVHHASPGPDRWKLRSLTYSGLAEAMAAQWG
jgi:hypothetical protein